MTRRPRQLMDEPSPCSSTLSDLENHGCGMVESESFLDSTRRAVVSKPTVSDFITTLNYHSHVEADDCGHTLTPPRQICRAGVELCLASWREAFCAAAEVRFGGMRAPVKKTEATRFRRVVILPRGLTALAKCERPRNRCRHRLFRRSFAVYSRQS